MKGEMQDKCPDDATLETYATGALDGPDMEHVKGHLTTCSACRERVDELRGDDELVGALRGLSGARELIASGSSVASGGVAGATVAGADVSSGVWPKIGGFTLLRVIGEGGMGVVFEADQLRPRRRVAVKVMSGVFRGSDSASSRRLKLFVREADALARLNHSDIAAVYSAGHSAEGVPYMAMELVDGLPLDRYLMEVKPGVAERLELLGRVCRAVDYAHGQGVVHRDLKPRNILVTRFGIPKVLDFGLAKLTDEDSNPGSRTSEGMVAGTAGYMSPEQMRGETGRVDGRTDVYALGVILYQCLTGRAPAKRGSSVGNMAREITEGVLPRASQETPELGGAIDAVVLRALAADVAERYQTAAELAVDMERCAAGLVPAASGLGQGVNRRKRNRRRARAICGGACALIGIVAGAIVMTGPSDVPVGRASEPVTVSPLPSRVVLAPDWDTGDLDSDEKSHRLVLERVAGGPKGGRAEVDHASKLGLILESRGVLIEAEKWFAFCASATRVRPAINTINGLRVARVLAGQGRGAEAQAALERLRAQADELLASDFTATGAETAGAVEVALCIACVGMAAGRKDEAYKALTDGWAMTERWNAGPVQARSQVLLARQLAKLSADAGKMTEADQWIARERRAFEAVVSFPPPTRPGR